MKLDKAKSVSKMQKEVKSPLAMEPLAKKLQKQNLKEKEMMIKILNRLLLVSNVAERIMKSVFYIGLRFTRKNSPVKCVSRQRMVLEKKINSPQRPCLNAVSGKSFFQIL